MVRQALLLALSISCFTSNKYEMGCECGVKELSKEKVEMCAESAKLEDQEENLNHLNSPNISAISNFELVLDYKFCTVILVESFDNPTIF